MSAGIAIVLGLLLYAIGLAPIVFLALRPAGARWLAPLFGALVIGLAFYQTGLLRDSSLASTDVTHLVRADTAESQCQQVFDLLLENQVLLEEPSIEGLVVRGAAWDQLPPPVREAVVNCAQSAIAAEGDIPLIRR